MQGEDGRDHIASRNTECLPCTDAEPLDVKLAHEPFHSCVVTGRQGTSARTCSVYICCEAAYSKVKEGLVEVPTVTDGGSLSEVSVLTCTS